MFWLCFPAGPGDGVQADLAEVRLQLPADLRQEALGQGRLVRPDLEQRAVLPQAQAELRVLEADILSVPEVAANPTDRCYYCKRALFARILEESARDGFPMVLDGCNASDDASDRPGMRALRELGVRSPLRECGIDKAGVRRLARQAGLPVWDKPSYACLATRVPAGTPITRTANCSNLGRHSRYTYRAQLPHTAARPAPWATSYIPLSSCSRAWTEKSSPPLPQPVRPLWDRLPAHMISARAS